jgi:hypothetical protein
MTGATAGPGRALFLALDLARMPALSEAVRRQPLPPDLLALIKVAAKDEEACRIAAEATGESPDALVAAAVFYLEQVLFLSGGDSFRTLGVEPGAPQSELRDHLKWLMRWLHPDRNADDWDSVYAERVLKAWREAKSPDKAAGDEAEPQRDYLAPPTSLRPARPVKTFKRRHRPRLPWIATPIHHEKKPSRVGRLTAALLAGGIALMALTLLPDCGAPWSWMGVCEAGVEHPGTLPTASPAIAGVEGSG